MTRTTVGLLALLALAAPAAAQQPPTPMLSQQLSAMAQSLAAGQTPITPQYAAFGAHRRGENFVVPLNAGNCYTFVGAGGMGVVDVDMFLFDPSGNRVALDRRYDPYTQILYCATFPGPYRVEMKVKRGAGEVAFQVFQTSGAAPALQPVRPAAPIIVPPPPAPPSVNPYPPAVAPPPAPIQVAADPLSAQVMSLASAIAPGMRLTTMLQGYSTEGKGHDLYVQLDGGRCYTLVTVAAPTMTRIYTYLWKPGNDRVATDKSDTHTSRLMHCATVPGLYHFQGKSADGAGEFRTGVFTP